jgi:transposase
MGGDDHRCVWRERVEVLEAELASTRADAAEKASRLAALEATVEKLQRHVFGKRSEKMPSVAKALRDAGEVTTDPDAALATRRSNAEAKAALPTREIRHSVADARKHCPKCGGANFSPLGDGKATVLYEFVPGHFERQVHIQEKLRCRCGETIVTAEPPPRPFEKAAYGPGLLAHVVVSKCADAIPIYRQAKQFRRQGVEINRSTLTDLFHRTAEELAPLSRRLVELIREHEIVLADETTNRVQAAGKTRTAWLWCFIARDDSGKEIIAYVHSPSRSGETPMRVLGETRGKLLVDGYTGYNKVSTPEGRERAGCLAHVRRRFFDALPTAPDAQRALELILEVYKVERAALDQEILGTEAHLALRREHSRSAMDAFKLWLDEQRPRHLPKGSLGQAISYTLAQWTPLTRFLEDARLPVDNNASERALRAAALGRKNWLFVGHDEAGDNLAGLFSLVATCEANGVNPWDYLRDVIMRVGSHPAAQLDDLLPHRWSRAA